MRLELLNEVNFGRAVGQMTPLLGAMPRRKARHSIRAARHVHNAGGGKRAVYTALLHDYLERGGDIEHLSDHIGELGLPDSIVQAVRALSSDEKGEEHGFENEPLVHLRATLNDIGDSDVKNIIVLAKMGDRIDNLKRRIRERGKIGKNYKRKSLELFEFLSSVYTGKPKLFERLKRRLLGLGLA